MKLKISDSLSLPIDAVTQTIGILAKRRAGKSYTARKFAEELSAAHQQIAIVDPKGDWWGIRSSADGKAPGLSIVILGGERGDVPLEVNGGEIVAKLVAEERVSVLLDLSLFRKNEVTTFMTAFLENLYRIKAREEFRTPMMLIVDEADAIAPQKPYKGEERMLGAAEDIVRRGGQRGIGCTLITQRSAVLNKNVLTQCQMLVALRTIAPQDLAAMNAWIDVHGTQKQRDTLMESLPALPTGDAWFWSPGWPTVEGIFKRVTVLPITTFDSGATPRPGEKRVEPKNAADVDLDSLRKTMAATIERAKAEDPKELRKKIAALEKDRREILSHLEKHGSQKIEIKTVEKPVLKDGQIDRLEKILDFTTLGDRFESILSKAAKPIIDRINQLDSALRPIRQALAAVDVGRASGLPDNGARLGPRTAGKFARALPIPERQPAGSVTPRRGVNNRRETPAGADNSEVSLGIGERRCAIAIAQHPNGVTREQLTTLTGYKRSTRNTYLQRLLAANLIDEISGRFLINDAGVAWLGNDYELLPTGSQLQDYWIRKLPEGESRIFQIVLGRPEEGISREQIGELTGYKRSTRNTYLQRLAARELVTISGEMIWPSETLFEEVAA
jgi:hypothetical protein